LWHCYLLCCYGTDYFEETAINRMHYSQTPMCLVINDCYFTNNQCHKYL
jgi:hypothetical protein